MSHDSFEGVFVRVAWVPKFVSEPAPLRLGCWVVVLAKSEPVWESLIDNRHCAMASSHSQSSAAAVSVLVGSLGVGRMVVPSK